MCVEFMCFVAIAVCLLIHLCIFDVGEALRELALPSRRVSGISALAGLRRVQRPALAPQAVLLGIHYKGVQWEGGAVDGGSII